MFSKEALKTTTNKEPFPEAKIKMREIIEALAIYKLDEPKLTRSCTNPRFRNSFQCSEQD